MGVARRSLFLNLEIALQFKMYMLGHCRAKILSMDVVSDNIFLDFSVPHHGNIAQ